MCLNAPGAWTTRRRSCRTDAEISSGFCTEFSKITQTTSKTPQKSSEVVRVLNDHVLHLYGQHVQQRRWTTDPRRPITAADAEASLSRDPSTLLLLVAFYRHCQHVKLLLVTMAAYQLQRRAATNNIFITSSRHVIKFVVKLEGTQYSTYLRQRIGDLFAVLNW